MMYCNSAVSYAITVSKKMHKKGSCMLKKFRKSLSVFVVVLALAAVPAALFSTASVSAANAPIADKLKCGSNLSLIDKCDTKVDGGSANITKIVTNIINIFSVIVGMVSVIMIIYGGFRYVTSAGDSGNVSSAKNTIIYAIIGLVVVALAQFIVQFVLSKITQP
jgi:uncharacterized membrane protein YidH (DUF202 family)